MMDEFFKEYESVASKRGIGPREMLVVLKAYAQYNADKMLGKPVGDCGWMKPVYWIAPALNRFGSDPVNVPGSYTGSRDFWERSPNNTRWRLSESGLRFVDDNKRLYEAAVSTQWIYAVYESNS